MPNQSHARSAGNALVQTLTILLGIWITSLAADPTLAQQQLESARIGRIRLGLVKARCGELAQAAEIKARAEAELSRAINASTVALAKMKADGKSPNEIDAVSKQLQVELTIKLQTLAKLVRSSRDSSRIEIEQAIDDVAKRRRLSSVVNVDTPHTGEAKLAGQTIDITEDVIKCLQQREAENSAKRLAMRTARQSENGRSSSQPALAEALFSGTEFSLAQRNIIASKGVELGSDSTDNVLSLLSGCVLLLPESSVQVRVQGALVCIPKRTVALVVATKESTAIYDLHDSLSNGRITVLTEKRKLALSPGTELLLSRNESANPSELKPLGSIGPRSPKSLEVGNNVRALISDFSIADEMATVPIVRSLLTATDPLQKRAATSIIKNATILADFSNSSSN